MYLGEEKFFQAGWLSVCDGGLEYEALRRWSRDETTGRERAELEKGTREREVWNVCVFRSWCFGFDTRKPISDDRKKVYTPTDPEMC
jgi:hypothetical protein